MTYYVTYSNAFGYEETTVRTESHDGPVVETIVRGEDPHSYDSEEE
jgi:hypothetical protein